MGKAGVDGNDGIGNRKEMVDDFLCTAALCGVGREFGEVVGIVKEDCGSSGRNSVHRALCGGLRVVEDQKIRIGDIRA